MDMNTAAQAPARQPNSGNAGDSPAGELMVEARDIHKAFGDNQVLKGVSLEVRAGEVILIAGRSICFPISPSSTTSRRPRSRFSVSMSKRPRWRRAN